MNIKNPLPLLHGQPHFVNDISASQGQLCVCLMTALSCIRGSDTCSTQTEHEFLIGTNAEHGMIKLLGRTDRTFYQALLPQTGFPAFASVSHMGDRMTHGKLKYLHMYGYSLMLTRY